MSDKKKLPLLGKSLVPELLSTPPLQAAGTSPRERVRARMRELVERGTALTAVAGLAAATSCAYNVVDPLPPPAQAGSGGKGGAAGKAPVPDLCPSPNALTIRIVSARWEAMTVRLELEVQNISDPQAKPVLIGASVAVPVHATIAADGQISVRSDQKWPEFVDLSLSYECSNAGRNTGYLVRLRLGTAVPADSGNLPAQFL
jgi:hypothetical protein